MTVGRTSELISGMTFLGIRHEPDKTTIDLLAWPKENKEMFEKKIEEKLKEKVDTIEAGTIAKMSSSAYDADVKTYFDTHIKKIANVLHLTLLTEDRDDLLIIYGDKEHYVYFGGMTKTLVYIACWMVVPNDFVANPKLLFWFLNTYYAQQLENLEDIPVDADALEGLTNLQGSPEY